MNQHEADSALARVLAALQNTAAPPGMDDRILKAIAREQPTQPIAIRRTSVWARMAVPPLAYSLAAAALFTLALGVWITHRGAAPGHASPKTFSPQYAVTYPPSEGTTANASTVATSSSADAQSALPSSHLHTGHPRMAASQASFTPPTQRTLTLPDSFPAPSAPLTAQERLLLRLVHQGDPQELAALDPAMRAAFDAQETTDFDDFFKPTVSPTPSTPASTPAKTGEANEPVQP